MTPPASPPQYLLLQIKFLRNLAVVLLFGIDTAWGAGQLIWSDEFTGDSVNTTNWTFDIGNGSGGWGNNELEYYTSRTQNVYVANGLLHIVAQQESYDGFNYTSAKLKTAGLFSCKYGLCEFYARLPQGQGYWPALWMMPENSVYGGWAASGEIDVTENKGSNPANVLGTIHFGGVYPNNTQSYGPSFTFPAGDSVTNFHLYALEWTTNSIGWYVDNQLYETQTNWWSSSNPTNTNIRNPYPAPFDQPFYIIMNLAVGGNFGGNPDDTTIFPGEMQVQYVRVYDGTPTVTPPSPPILQLEIPFNDLPGTTTTSSTTNGAAASVTLHMVNSSGNPADYHGAANSGAGNPVTGNRALDFSSNGANQPGNPGPLVSVTNVNFNFGSVTNFIASLWFKQNAMMNGNIGPRLFVLGDGDPGDTGAANSIGVKFQTASQLYLQIGGTTISATFTNSLPTNTWIFIAAAYDGANATFYEGTETNAVSEIVADSVTTSINFGSTNALFIGNRQDQNRSFDGWMDDFRFYTGVGDINFIDGIRQAEITPAALSFHNGPNGITFGWPAGFLQSASNVLGPWLDVSNSASPYSVLPTNPQQFFRLRFQ